MTLLFLSTSTFSDFSGTTLIVYHVSSLSDLTFTGTETVTDTNTTYDLTTTASTTNAKVNLVAGGSGSGTDTVTITGAGRVSVKSDASGNVTITGATIPTNHKTKQTAKTDPTASGNSSTFIASITQNENGEITATKKNVSISVSAGATDDDVVILSNIISVIYYILDLELDPEDFMELAVEPGDYAGEAVKEYVRNFKIANNFVYNLFNEVKYIHNDIIDEFASEIGLLLQSNLIYEDNE